MKIKYTRDEGGGRGRGREVRVKRGGRGIEDKNNSVIFRKVCVQLLTHEHICTNPQNLGVHMQ